MPTQPDPLLHEYELTYPPAYTITYAAADSYGNQATPITRVVHVASPCDHPEFWCVDEARCSEGGSCEVVTDICQVTPDIPACSAAATPPPPPPPPPPPDISPPVITLRGDGSVAQTLKGETIMEDVVLVGSLYTHPGALANDDENGDVSASITAAGLASVGTSHPTPEEAPFVVTYTASDAAGNAAVPAFRVVHVVCEDEEQGCF